jgi:hypothetical protein
MCKAFRARYFGIFRHLFYSLAEVSHEAKGNDEAIRLPKDERTRELKPEVRDRFRRRDMFP